MVIRVPYARSASMAVLAFRSGKRCISEAGQTVILLNSSKEGLHLLVDGEEQIVPTVHITVGNAIAVTVKVGSRGQVVHTH